LKKKSDIRNSKGNGLRIALLLPESRVMCPYCCNFWIKSEQLMLGLAEKIFFIGMAKNVCLLEYATNPKLIEFFL